MLQARSINEVILQLDEVIAWCKNNRSRMGYFATLYRKVTIAVQEAISNKSFEDCSRLDRLDTIFANRYLAAWNCFITNQRCTQSWIKTFNAARTNNLTVIQHLLLGINTHINLDLAVAAAETCPGEKIYDLQNDFEKINTVIASLVQTVQDELSAIWWPLKFFADINNNRRKAIINFSIDNAR